MSLRKILETFIRFFPSSFNRKYVHTVACTVGILSSTLIPAAMLLVLFPAVPTKTMVHAVALTVFLTVSCKGSVCVAVLTSFYGRFFVEEGQFINSTSSLHLCRHFFICWRRLALAQWNRESESSGSQPVYRKLFPRGPHSSKNNFLKLRSNALKVPLRPITALGLLCLLKVKKTKCWKIYNWKPA